MANKTQMGRLLRLVEFGAGQDGVLREAWECWRGLDEETQQAMVAGKFGRAADGRRARLWAAAWDGGMETVLDREEDLDERLRQVAAGVRWQAARQKKIRQMAQNARTLVDLVDSWIDRDLLPAMEIIGLIEVVEATRFLADLVAPVPMAETDVHPLEFPL